MVATPQQFENLHERLAQSPGEWRLILAPRPSAVAVKYLTIPHPTEAGVIVEKYSTRFGYNYEKWVYPNGVETWWKLIKLPPK